MPTTRWKWWRIVSAAPRPDSPHSGSLLRNNSKIASSGVERMKTDLSEVDCVDGNPAETHTMPAATMILYYADLMYPRKACAAASYLGAPVGLRLVDVERGEHKSDAYLARNPNGTLPTLVDGDTAIWESNAILCYLARKMGSNFWPTDKRLVDVIRWLSWDAAGFGRHAGELYFQLHVLKRFGLGSPDNAAVADARTAFANCAAILDRHLSERDWVVGAAPTAADFALGAAFPYAGEIALPLAPFPAIRAWYERLSALPGWASPFDLPKSAGPI